MDDFTTCESCSKEPKKTINVQRFINKLDECFMTDDLDAADKLIDAWTDEAQALGDLRGLLTVQNEALGFYRRTNDFGKAEKCIDTVVALVDKTGVARKVSGATVYVNLATTLKAFGRAADGLKYYDMAESVYLDGGMEESYEYSALLNNRSSALSELKRFDEAEENLTLAIDILKKEGKHDGEVAVALINLAHVVYDRDEKDTDKVEKLLDEAWDYINSPRQKRDANYAFIISKCAPSLRYFGRTDEADALVEVAKVIYGKK